MASETHVPFAPSNGGDLQPESAVRMACDLCRKRKLKCDKVTPSCGSCIRLHHSCVYGHLRVKKTQNRRTHTRQLEMRLAQIETLLQAKNQPGTADVPPQSHSDHFDETQLSLEDTQELEGLYFNTVHMTMPILHRSRYTTAISLAPELRPPIYLRHAIWALGASASQNSPKLEESLYHSSRHHLEDHEKQDQCLNLVNLAQAQTWILISMYEMLRMHLHRCWMSTGRAVRICQMLELNHPGEGRICHNSIGNGYKNFHWTDQEERRRTFWMAFCMDRFQGITHGWPMIIDERDVRIVLPVAEDAYQACREIKSMTIQEALIAPDAELLSAFAAVVVITDSCSRKLRDLERYEAGDHSNSTGDFWQKNRWFETTLATDFSVPQHLTISPSDTDSMLIALNLAAPSYTICVQQAAENVAKKNGVAEKSFFESRKRRLEAATTIISIVELTSGMDQHLIHPGTSFCLYNAATVFAHSLALQPDFHKEQQLTYILHTMNQMKATNPLPETFLLDLDNEFPTVTKRILGRCPELNTVFNNYGGPTKSSEVGIEDLNQAASTNLTSVNQDIMLDDILFQYDELQDSFSPDPNLNVLNDMAHGYLVFNDFMSPSNMQTPFQP